METIIRQFGPTPTKFVMLVGHGEYKNMLVVKAVEIIMAKSTSAMGSLSATVAFTAAWLEK